MAKTGPKGPYKLTKDTIGKLKEAFAIDASIKEACYYAGINPDTYYTWVKKHPRLAELFDSLRQKLPLQARHNIASKIHGDQPKGDVSLSQWLLERKKPDEFSPKQKVEHSGAISTDDILDDAQHPEDEAVRKEYREKLKDNIRKRALESAKNRKGDHERNT